MARRSGDDWFLVALNGPAIAQARRAAEVSSATASTRPYIVRDVADEPTRGRSSTQTTVAADDTLAIELEPGGGFIARFTQR